MKQVYELNQLNELRMKKEKKDFLITKMLTTKVQNIE